jgi:hypothetical protein
VGTGPAAAASFFLFFGDFFKKNFSQKKSYVADGRKKSLVDNSTWTH